MAVSGFALLIRPRRAIAVMLLFAIALVLVPRMGTISWFEPRPNVRVMSINTFLGEADDASIAEAVARVRPDVLALIETNQREVDSVAQRTGFVAVSQVEPGEGGADGVALLVNRNGRLASFAALGGPGSVNGIGAGPASVSYEEELTRFQMPILNLPNWHRSGSRAGAIAGRQVAIAAVHPVAPLGNDQPAWNTELHNLVRWSSSEATRRGVILMGDFNATRWHPQFRSFTRLEDCVGHAAARPTWPAQFPVLRLDHVMTNGNCGDAGTIRIDGSDHRAVWADIAFKDSQQ